jgi:quercetin dioxygenase-like cupin family protein
MTRASRGVFRSAFRGDRGIFPAPRSSTLRAALIGCAIACGVGGPAAAQRAIEQTVLERSDVPGTNYEVLFEIIDIAPNTVFKRHTHPATETGYVIDGELMLEIDESPPLQLRAGQSYQVPATAVQAGHSGAARSKLIAVFVIEKGARLTSPAK